MLEDRPIVQRTLIGAGAFAFVFGAAMAGSAFMISGGFGFGADRSDRQSDTYATVRVADFGDWAAPDAYAAPTEYSYSPPQGEVSPMAYTPPAESVDEVQAEPAAYAPVEELDGQSRAAQTRLESTDEALARIDQTVHVQNSEPDMYAGAYVAPVPIQDTPAADAYAQPAPTEKTPAY